MLNRRSFCNNYRLPERTRVRRTARWDHLNIPNIINTIPYSQLLEREPIKFKPYVDKILRGRKSWSEKRERTQEEVREQVFARGKLSSTEWPEVVQYRSEKAAQAEAAAASAAEDTEEVVLNQSTSQEANNVTQSSGYASMMQEEGEDEQRSGVSSPEGSQETPSSQESV